MELTGLHQRLQREKRRGGVADGEDAGLFQRRRPLHGYEGAGHAPLLGLHRHIRVRHEAVYLSTQRGEDRLIDPGLGHLGIGDDVTARPQGGNGLLHRVVGKGQIVHIVKIRRGVDDPFDDQLILRIQPPVTQQLGDDGEAALLDIHRLHLLHHSISFLQAVKKRCAMTGLA